MIEYDRNLLKSCAKNSILFIGGDSEFDPITYLQLIENYRQDVILIAFPLLDRPWYVQLLKKGMKDYLPASLVSWKEEQIQDIHPYPWDTTMVEIPISKEMIEKYNLKDSVMYWKLSPDLKSNLRTLLGTKLAVLLNVIKTNNWERSIYFSAGLNLRYLSGLNEYFEWNGLVLKLLPFKTTNTDYNFNIQKIEEIFYNRENFINIKNVKNHDMPRVSHALSNYRVPFINLADYYKGKNNFEKAKDALDKMEEIIPKSILPMDEMIKKIMFEIRQELDKNEKK